MLFEHFQKKGKISLEWVLCLIFILPMICSSVSAALVVDMNSGTLYDSLNEGTQVKYSIGISGIPAQTNVLELTTDLVPVPESSLWTSTSKSVKILDALNSSTIHISAENELPESVLLTVVGRVPIITTVTNSDGIVITKRPPQRSGYSYYHVKALDSKGQLVGTAATETFTITIPDEEDFLNRANTLFDASFRAHVVNMYQKGLTDEAWDSLILKENESEPLPGYLPVVIGLVALIIGIAAGIFIGKKIFGKKIWDEKTGY